MIIVALLAACSSSNSIDYHDSLATLTPASWLDPSAWLITIYDHDEQSIGSIKLLLTEVPVDESYCDNVGWNKAAILEDSLQLNIDQPITPAYIITGPWITIDLMGTVCNTDYKLLGELAADSAEGFVSYSHSLGGEHFGSFAATPILSQATTNDR